MTASSLFFNKLIIIITIYYFKKIVGISGDEAMNLNLQKVKGIFPLAYLIEDILCENDNINYTSEDSTSKK